MVSGFGVEMYGIILMINHPNKSLAVITDALERRPDYKWQAGQCVVSFVFSAKF